MSTTQPAEKVVWKFKPKSDYEKEVLSWATGANPNGGVKALNIRKVGISQNVTEERMLHGHIMELSKARYKIIKEKECQKNRFLDKQQKKAKTLTHLLDNLNFDQYRQKNVTAIESSREKSLKMRLQVLIRFHAQHLADFTDEELGTMTEEEIMNIVKWKKHGLKTSPGVMPLQENKKHRSNSLFLTDGSEEEEVDKRVDRRAPFYADNHHDSVLQPTELHSRRISQHGTRGALHRRKASDQRKRHKSSMDLVSAAPITEDPRCMNLISSLIPLPPSLLRPVSRQTLPSLLHNIDSLSYPSPRSYKVASTK